MGTKRHCGGINNKATGGAGGKRSRGEASGEEGAALGKEKRQRRARGGKKKGHNQRLHEGREAESRR